MLLPSRAFRTALHKHNLSCTGTSEKSWYSSLGLLAAGSAVSMDTIDSGQSDAWISRTVLNGAESSSSVLSVRTASTRDCQPREMTALYMHMSNSHIQTTHIHTHTHAHTHTPTHPDPHTHSQTHTYPPHGHQFLAPQLFLTESSLAHCPPHPLPPSSSRHTHKQ